jgi:PAS domain S-box-containing protein
LLEYKVYDRTKELESEKNKLQIIFDNLPSGFIQIDKSGKIKSSSASMKVISGKKSSELIGLNCFDILSCCKKYGKCRAVELFQTGGFKSPLKKFFSETDDSVFEHTLVPIKKDGNIDSILEIITDITESRRLQDHLIRSEKLATTGEMSAIVAHEIRNSLTSVRMILQLLSRSSNLTVEDKESYDVALNSIARMESVVEDLLKIARPAKLERKPTKINDVLDESLKLAEHQILSKEIDIVVDSDNEIPEIPLDPDRLKEAFINLILNASQAIEESGKISISSKMIILDKDLYDFGEIFIDGDLPKVNLQKIILRNGSSVIRIEISDNGCGISHENKERIFDPFFTTKVNGTGLGLSLVKRVINQHGGIIAVDSQVGYGCKFSIFIPNTL